MSKSSAPKTTPTPAKGKVKQQASADQRRIFFAAVVDMSWQLAIVVLVPIVGGYELDKHFKTTPTLTIIGFVLAMAGTFMVMRRVVAQANELQTKTVGDQRGHK